MSLESSTCLSNNASYVTCAAKYFTSQNKWLKIPLQIFKAGREYGTTTGAIKIKVKKKYNSKMNYIFVPGNQINGKRDTERERESKRGRERNLGKQFLICFLNSFYLSTLVVGW